MEEIKHTYTIQWVGPMDLKDYQDYVKNEQRIDTSYFNFYYFEAREDRRFKYMHTYLGIHKKNDGIQKRLNKNHEHFGKFIDAKELKIWIGSFANERHQTAKNIDIVETVFIRAYKDMLSDNTKKKKSLPGESVCIINMWFGANEKLKTYNRLRPTCIDDVLMYYSEEQIFMHGNLNKMKL